MNEVTHGRIIPLYHQDMLDEYYEVLHRVVTPTEMMAIIDGKE